MSATQGPPTLLVFGPQTSLPSDEVLADVRSELVGNHSLSALCNAAVHLPRFWDRLVASDPSLRPVPGAEQLARLARWIEHGGSLLAHHAQGPVPNHLALAVTLLVQIAQYARYLGHLGDAARRRGGPGAADAQLDIISAVGGPGSGGIQGFCVGLLSAVAVASADGESGLGPAAAVALRLAVCVGAYVDLDGVFAPDTSRTLYSCLAVRWREGKQVDVGKLVGSYSQVSHLSLFLILSSQAPC